jgi:hypothetical protein
LDEVVLRTLVSVLVAVTLPPGTDAPDGSLTVPVMDAVIVCAGARLANRDSTATSRQIFLRIRLLLFVGYVDRVLDQDAADQRHFSRISYKTHKNTRISPTKQFIRQIVPVAYQATRNYGFTTD